jgi:hypothetical protein
MNRRPQIPDAVRKDIDDLLKKSGEQFQAGDRKEALALAHQAWDLIPEPKATWDYYPQSLATGFVEDYADLGEIAATQKWIEVTHEVYDDANRTNHYPLMLEGTALLRLGLQNEAREVFARIFELYGAEGFKGEHSAYLKLLKS